MTGYTVKEFVGLSGIYSIELKNPLKVVLSGRYPYCRMVAVNDEVEIHLFLNLQSSYVRGELIHIKNPGKGNGFKVFESHLEKVTDAGFRLITIEAAREPLPDGTEMNGYITWGKFGFTMTITSQVAFDELMMKLERRERTLHILLKSKTGENLWKEHGTSWEGVFYLNKLSRNRRIFRLYQRRKIAKSA